jgi:hypothetical protein
MTKTLEKFILRHRHHCELPDKSGLPVCRSKATEILELGTDGYCYTVAVCPDCAAYVRRHPHQCKTPKFAP